MCRGACPSRFSWTVTPHVAWIGRQVPDGSTSGGVHGPAATSTASAAIVHPSERTTPVARPSRSIGLAVEPTTMTAPRSWASAAHAAVAADGRHREARRQPDGGGAGRERRFEPLELVGLDQVRPELREGFVDPERLRAGAVEIRAQQEQPGRLVADREPVAGDARERAVAGEALGVEASEDRVERMLDRAEVAAGRAGPDGRLLDEDDGRAPVGHDRRCRGADDAPADDDDVGLRRRVSRIGPATFHRGRIVGRRMLRCRLPSAAP